MHPSATECAFMQRTLDVNRSDDGGRILARSISGNLPSDFGFRSMFTHTSEYQLSSSDQE